MKDLRTLFFGGSLIGLLIAISLFRIFFDASFWLLHVVLAVFVFFLLFLSNLKFALFSIILFLPFEKLGAFEISGYTLRLGQLLIFASFLVILLKFKIRKTEIKNSLLVPLVVFLLIGIISSVLNGFSFRNLEVLLFTAYAFSVCFVIKILFNDNDEKNISVLMKLIILCSLFAAFFGFYQLTGEIIGLPKQFTLLRWGYGVEALGFPRIQSIFLEPLYYGNFLLLPLGLLISTKFFGGKIFSKRKDNLSLIFLLANLGLTFSRGAFIAFLGMLIIVSVFLILKRIYKKLFLLWFSLIALFFSGIFLIGIFKASVLSNLYLFFSEITGQASFEERVSALGTAFEFFKEEPFFGIGPGNYGPRTVGLTSRPPKGWPIVNNEYFEILAEYGIFGLLTFGLFVFVILIKSVAAIKIFHLQNCKTNFVFMFGLLLAFLGFLVQYWFFSTLYVTYIWVVVGLIMAMLGFAKKDEKLKYHIPRF